MFVALAVQFVYRYFAMTKNPNICLFNSWRMSLWYAAMISISICFGIIAFICGYLMEGARVDGFRESLFSTFELPENSTVYYSRMTYYSTVPCIFLYFPSLIYFIFPIFNIELGLFSNIAGITFVIYPVLDPLAVIYVIKHYRCFVFKLFCLSHKIQPNIDAEQEQNDVAMASEVEVRTEGNNEIFMSFNRISSE
ncbi:hypothetical protein GCK72_012729 [Caenorhabditis remanei]|uniref:Uncharacterized protein n=1 Tax=Caenorhabditis remanei TaxID=31234 RepID=A0A6A5GP59_CAERE|nr:hypothetical protein GCK72_012729 [Caenorhabditis remanei]KAF1756276.1 hypothetical protein GCK72_012729 [Caenorhabditis remanei]